jgi:hypothetical protein
MGHGIHSVNALASLCAVGLLASCDKKMDTNATPPAQHSAVAMVDKPKTVLELLQQNPDAIRDSNLRMEAVKAVKEIGDRKEVEAIPSLLGAMFIIRPVAVRNATDFSVHFPCSEALIKIGESAVPQVQAQFLVAKSGVEQMVLLHVLIKINGARPTSDWLEEVQGMKLVPERRQRYAELKTWVLSHSR